MQEFLVVVSGLRGSDNLEVPEAGIRGRLPSGRRAWWWRGRPQPWLPLAVAFALLATSSLGVGQADLLVVPQLPSVSGELQASAAEGLSLHLVPVDSHQEYVVSATEPAQAPYGTSRVWLQGEGLMTPFSQLVSNRAGETEPLELPVVAAGIVEKPVGFADEEDLVLHLFHAGDYRVEGTLRWELWLRRPLPEITGGVLMPEGPTVALLWDERRDRFVAASRPFEVSAAAPVSAPLRAPGPGGDLWARVAKRSAGPKGSPPEIELLRSQERHAPDLEIEVAEHYELFWYDLEPGPISLQMSSPLGFLDESLELLAGEVRWFETTLRAPARLTVEWSLPPRVRSAETAISLQRLPASQEPDVRSLPSSESSVVYAGLPAGSYELALETELGRTSRPLRLVEGEDGYQLMAPSLITLQGSVTQGDEGRRARLQFRSPTRNDVATWSDENGEYVVDLLEPAAMATVTLPGEEESPTVEYFRPPIEESRQLDFVLPDHYLTVRVVDAESGRPIEAAAVISRNLYPDSAASDGHAAGKTRGVTQRTVTDVEGVASLPPLRAGTVEIEASAKGYRRMTEPLEIVVAEGFEPEAELRLDPMGETRTVQLVLPRGGPAPGARVFLRDPTLMQEQTTARADRQGQVELPLALPGVAVVQHPEAGFSAYDWPPADGAEELTWVLPPAAAPLQIRAVDGRGEGVAQAEMALRVEGRWYLGPMLALLTRGQVATDPQGFWQVAGLPAAAVDIVVWPARRGRIPQWLESEVVRIDPPWGEVLDVPVVQWAP